MRRTTAAAVGTLTGAALILGVRLSVATTPLAAPPPAFDLSDEQATGRAPSASPPAREESDEEADEQDAAPPERNEDEADEDAPGGLQDGEFTGAPVDNPYGTVQVAVRIRDGRVTSTAVSFPTTGQSAPINADAIPKLKQQTLQAQSAEIDAVSGATYTSEAYIDSLQAALDAAGG